MIAQKRRSVYNGGEGRTFRVQEGTGRPANCIWRCKTSPEGLPMRTYAITMMGKRFCGLLLPLAVVLSGCAARPSTGLLVSHVVDVQPAPPPQVTLLFAGDIMLARTPGQALARGTDPFGPFADLLRQADLAVGNLECVVASVGARVPKLYNFRCHPRSVAALARYGWVVSLANNHSGDYGKDAFAEELSLLKQGGVASFGGGANAREAHAPLVIEKKGLKIAFLGYDEIELRSYEAGQATPGVAWSDDDAVVRDVQAAKRQADLVVVFPHWGLEYHTQPSDRQKQLARTMIDAGADLVVGSHPHVTEGAEYYKGKLIVYSLGNFVFDDFLDVGPDLKELSRTGWVLRATLDKAGLVRWDIIVSRDDDEGIPRPVTGATAPCGSRESERVSRCQADL